MNKNFIIYIIVFAIIFASFIIPNKLFEKQEAYFEVAVYEEKYPEENNISIEAEEIYLVKALHDIESENVVVTINYNMISEKVIETEVNETTKPNEITSEIEELKEYNIINDIGNSNGSELAIRIVNKLYQKNKEKYKYTISNISLIYNEQNYELDIEEKTGKIIMLAMKKENLNEAIEKKQILENYIKYLDLDIIDDWVYENNTMKSKKANISVILLEDVKNGVIKLSVHSNETVSGSLLEYVEAEN